MVAARRRGSTAVVAVGAASDASGSDDDVDDDDVDDDVNDDAIRSPADDGCSNDSKDT